MRLIYQLFAKYFCKGPCGEQRGKALSVASISERSSQSPIHYRTRNATAFLLFFVSMGFVQLVAPRQTYLRYMSVGELLRNYKSCAYSQKQINLLCLFAQYSQLRYPPPLLYARSALGFCHRSNHLTSNEERC